MATTDSCTSLGVSITNGHRRRRPRERPDRTAPESAWPRPSKLTPELQEQILTAIREGGCTYADACFKAGINESTFHRWKQKGQEQDRGRFREFCNELKGAEAGFRAVRLQRIVDAAEKSQVRVRKTVRSMGDGDDAKIFQEVVEETVLPDPRWDAWLLERKYPEMFSRKHVEVTANTESPPVMQLVIVDPVKKRGDGCRSRRPHRGDSR